MFMQATPKPVLQKTYYNKSYTQQRYLLINQLSTTTHRHTEMEHR